MRTYLDQNRLTPEGDRRFHAADLELAGGVVQVVPAVVERLTPLVAVGAWSWSDQQIARREALAHPGDSPSGLRVQRWWCRQWQIPNGLYRVRALSRDEHQIARHLLGPGGIPSECFPRAEGDLLEDNDANIVAQIVTVGGTLLLTSDKAMVDDEILEDWFARSHNRWPVPDRGQPLVRRVDALYDEWWENHPGAPDVLADTAVAAFWPAADDAPADTVREDTLTGVAALSRGHFQTFGPKLGAYIKQDPHIEERIARVRDNLPARMRQGERRRQSMLASEPLAPLTDNAPSRPRAGSDSRYDW